MNCFVQSFCSLLVLPRGMTLCIYVGFGINLGFQLESNLWVVAVNRMVLCRLCFLVFFFNHFILHSNYRKKIYAFMVLSSVVQVQDWYLDQCWSQYETTDQIGNDWASYQMPPLVRQGHEVMPALYQYICAKINTHPTLVLSCPIFCVFYHMAVMSCLSYIISFRNILAFLLITFSILCSHFLACLVFEVNRMFHLWQIKCQFNIERLVGIL